MKFRIFLALLASILLLASGCTSQKSDFISSQNHSENSLPSIPKNVFSSSKKNQNISQTEMKKSISQYLDINNALAENANELASDTDLNKKKQKKLNELFNKIDENDNNFNKYIRENNIPNNLQKVANKSKNYTISTNEFLRKIHNEVKQVNDNQKSVDHINRIEVLNEQYKDKVNGKEQQELEKLLNKHNIKTKAFK
ncbi:NDxxF motif lipoprotein [Staphylococcus haemolyticus]|uniref:NDxxF motif lipoprotein n=1 Tax=Staphylococcus haemolyticus TaxID=1283 RepID=UPI0034DD7DD2